MWSSILMFDNQFKPQNYYLLALLFVVSKVTESLTDDVLRNVIENGHFREAPRAFRGQSSW